MRRATQELVLTLVGATLVRLTVTDAYLRYVNEWMRWPLLGSGVLLVVLALARVLRGREQTDSDADSGAAPDHGGGVPHAAWLLLAPVLVVFTISPPALGAYAAERSTGDVPRSAGSEESSLPLPATDGPAELSVVDFVVRVEYDEARSLRDREVRMTGFVSYDDAGGWYVTRLSMACCAADASAFRVEVSGAEAPPRNTWVEVTGQWDPGSGGTPEPVLAVSDVTEVDQPRNPYV